MAGGNSSDTTATYDSHGNPLTATTYTGANMGGTARTTRTTYETTFNAFPITVESGIVGGGAALLTEHADYDYRMGTPTKVTDPNGVDTAASYDAFGRITALIRPGDIGTAPTVQFLYYDTETPYHAIALQLETSGTTSITACRPSRTGWGGRSRRRPRAPPWRRT